MKLLQLSIKNFRGLKGDNNKINFSHSDIIFLIGQNNVGKSSFLRAYQYFVNPKQKVVKEDFYNYDTSIPIEIEGIFKIENNDDSKPDLAKNEPDWVKKWSDGDKQIKIKKIWSKENDTFKKYTFDPAQNAWQENGFGGIDSLFTTYSPTPIYISAMEDETSLSEKVNKLMQDSFIKKVQKEHKEKFDCILEKIKDLQNDIVGSEAVAKINESLNENFKKVFADLTLKIEPEKDSNIKLEDSFKKNHSIIVKKTNVDRKETFLQNGHGVIRQALFNFLSATKEEKGEGKEIIILYEEPELFLHPKISFKLRKALYELVLKSQYQVICSTHSPLMIDLSKEHSSLVRVTKNNNEETNTYQVETSLFSEEDKNRVQMINRFNPHICEAFYADKVLVVEGDTETIFYREVLSKFYPNEEIFVLNSGSKMNIPFFQKILTQFHIEHYVIHDTDSPKALGQSPTWTMNERIWEEIEESNAKYPGIARRYVHTKNFESANGILQKDVNRDGKPLSAFNFSREVEKNSNCPAMQYLRDIVGERKILHDRNYIDSLKITSE